MITYGRFSFAPAESEALLNAIFRLRYEIYVNEFGFEKPEDHPGGLERDPYDPYALHFAATDTEGQVIGTIRMILNSEKGFPIEHAARLNFNGFKPPPRDRTAEISRLAVSKKYRRRQEDGIFGVESYLKRSEGGILQDNGSPPKMIRRERPVIVLGLFQAMYHECKRRGITHMYMITEEKLYFALRNFGICFKKIGDPVQYHGIRIPYMGKVAEIENNLKQQYPKTLRMLLTGLEPEYHP
ncbi:MAG: PEP-CTERM/exosortase system-associated acyltransferase [Deltaproteobacteria bacterium]|nr:PEP-CTERM/exosortase system-associated acyltransferase [Deltaproteobacteria bacterium]